MYYIITKNILSFSKSLRHQLRVIYAIIMREMLTAYGKRQLGFLWAILEPIFHVSVIGIIKYAMGLKSPDGIHLVNFLLTGLVPYLYLRNIVNKTISALSANKGLLVFQQVSFLDFYYARFILETATSIAVFFITLTISNFIFQEISIYNFLGIVKVFCVIGLLGFGIGLVFAAITPIMDSAKILTTIIFRVFYFTSGILFSIKYIPEQYYDILYWNPMLHCVEMMRSSFFISYQPVDKFMNLDYPLSLSGLLILVGFILVLRMKRWVLR